MTDMGNFSQDPHETERELTATAPRLEPAHGAIMEAPTATAAELRNHADAICQRWQTHPVAGGQTAFGRRLISLRTRLAERLRSVQRRATGEAPSAQMEVLENSRLFSSVLQAAESSRRSFAELPHTAIDGNAEIPRVLVLAENYISAAGGIWSPESLQIYVEQTQSHGALLMAEIAVLPLVLQLAQVEFVLDRVDEETLGSAASHPVLPDPELNFSAVLHSLRRMTQFEWSPALERLVAFDPVLRRDPAGVFAAMDDETRSAYHRRVSTLGKHSDHSELEIAQTALELAQAAARAPVADRRYQRRVAHIGYYLFAEGLPLLARRIGYAPPPIERLRSALQKWSEDIYILGILIFALVPLVVIIAPLIPNQPFWPIMAAFLLLLIPASQGGVDLINKLLGGLLIAEALPKLNFADGVPDDAVTLVVVPTLLLHEKQVNDLCDALEVRYLSNHESNLHFCLLTDLPDTTSQPAPGDRNPLVDLAVQRIDTLNSTYSSEGRGAFFLLHRHRVFNVRQGVWMGWERKRGKLLDLNKLLLKTYDSFPIKAGPLQVLDRVRFVITLDSDTQLPPGSAVRMVGAIAHPLNQAIIDPKLGIVTVGYGILQPRVGVSVASASRTRLSSLYSGETGFDIYTRAVSDIYQDLFHEGIFTGKGIYEVSIFHQVLDHRFPRNALLSHDLIEGSYIRAGLVTDIEVIDDYPSHYSAHSRRKHRWVRGDWQVAQWLFGSVPDESGRFVPNPISTISRWKIFDNLRRSLVEPITFFMLVLGWFVLPGGAVYWTIATVLLLLFPTVVKLVLDVGRGALNGKLGEIRESFRTFASAFGIVFLDLTFLLHHALLSLDAIGRSLTRTLVSGKRLLEWETAEQAESGGTTTPLDLYLRVSPLLALLLAIALGLQSLRGLLAAAPILALWALEPVFVLWLNAAPHQEKRALAVEDKVFLREQALLIWRYFQEFGGEKNHWLIPDNVEENNLHEVRRLSPTNLGLLLNARLAALELGFLTLPDFVQATLGSLESYDRLEKHRGHIYNWYEIEGLRPVPPFILSTVDNGNLAASFLTLHAAALDLLKRPLLSADNFSSFDARPGAAVSAAAAGAGQAFDLRTRIQEVLVQSFPAEPGHAPQTNTTDEAESTAALGAWVVGETARQHLAFSHFIGSYLPWLLPRFGDLFALPQLTGNEERQAPTLIGAPDYAAGLQAKLAEAAAALPAESKLASLAAELHSLLLIAQKRLTCMKSDLAAIAAEAERYALAMDFGFLLVESRQLLSIGYDAEKQELLSSCYDLLASEARIASFIAVAKGDISQKSWFRLDRTHVLSRGRAALVSWTGTMFEYMMPSLWMRSFPDTLIARSLDAAVALQRGHVRKMPWGISESGFAKTDEQGRYGYKAWGIPALALQFEAEDGPVISPYSSFLALPVREADAIANLRRMVALGWTGRYGLYEAADYIGGNGQLVRSWMAHHQGMSLLAIANALRNGIFQRWFHANPRVRAVELLLHEKPLSKDAFRTLAERSAKPETSDQPVTAHE